MSSANPPARLVSLDAYRGFIMLVMASGGLAFAQINNTLELLPIATSTWGHMSGPGGVWSSLVGLFPNRMGMDPVDPAWDWLSYQFDHVPWIGCAFWDLIQPSFMFMVGVALPYSLASREQRGDSYGMMVAHAIWRSLLLILLAVFLSSPLIHGKNVPEGPITNWVFTNVLAQIGLGYVFVFLLAGRGFKVQLIALMTILVGYTLYFGLYPLPPEGFDYTSVRSDVPRMTGWFAHWNKNTNAGHHFDLWFLNLFPRATEFTYNHGGYVTLNFIPSMATMILGLMAGEVLRSERGQGQKFALLALGACVCLAGGWVMGMTVCPIVKRIWTPSWAVFSSGWTFAMLALFYGIIDVLGFKRWAFPLEVVGMNSIAIYCMSQMMKPWIRDRLRIHIGTVPFQGILGPTLMSASILFVLWLFCFWMYRRRIFLRI